MKRVLLAIILSFNFLISIAQVALNEIFTTKANCSISGTNSSQFFEVYNGSGSTVTMDCYALVVWYGIKTGNNTTESGFYVVDFPADLVESGKTYVGAGLTGMSTSFCYGNGLTYRPDLNWTGIAKKYVKNGNGYSPSTILNNGEDIFYNSAGGSNYGTSFNYNAFLFGVIGGQARLINGIVGGIKSQTIFPIEIASMPTIPNAINCGGTEYEISFQGLGGGSAEYTVETPGNGNGYYRQKDGQCGSWTKSASPSNHTPGTVTNTTSTAFYYITTSQVGFCGGNNSPVDIIATFNYPTGENPYPIDYFIVRDENGNNNLDGDGVDFWSPVTTVSSKPTNDQITINNLYWGETYFIYARSQQGCFFAIQTVSLPGCIVTPVTFSNFHAQRNRQTVALKWETLSEQNNRGFNVQRNTRGVWETIAFVFSAADGGNSATALSYEFRDANTEKGVSQYRIQQVDFDGKASYSAIRSVKGLEQAGTRTVVYPNPSQDGKVSVVFEDQGAKAVVVSDMSGRIIRQYRNVLNNVLIEGLESGMYSIQVTDLSSAVSSTEKVIIKKR